MCVKHIKTDVALSSPIHKLHQNTARKHMSSMLSNNSHGILISLAHRVIYGLISKGSEKTELHVLDVLYDLF